MDAGFKVTCPRCNEDPPRAVLAQLVADVPEQPLGWQAVCVRCYTTARAGRTRAEALSNWNNELDMPVRTHPESKYVKGNDDETWTQTCT